MNGCTMHRLFEVQLIGRQKRGVWGIYLLRLVKEALQGSIFLSWLRLRLLDYFDGIFVRASDKRGEDLDSLRIVSTEATIYAQSIEG